MTQSNREAAIKATLAWEGGYCNDAEDAGGPTNWGITIADAKKYWKKNATAEDVKAMPKDIAVDIYRTKYWKTPFYDCDKLAAGVDLAVFDFGVNSGPSRAAKYLKSSVGGPDAETINKVFDYREGFLRGLSNFPTFGKGWLNRTKDLRKKSLLMAQAPITIDKTEATKQVGQVTTASTIMGLAWYWFGLIGLGVVGALGLAAFIAYKLYQRKHNAVANTKAS